MPVSQIGPGVIQESTGTHLINELDIPIVVLGLDNAIVAACHAGILVADKRLTPKLKEYIPAQTRPMYEERRWGWYKVLDCQKHEDGTEVLTKKIRIFAGRNISYQLHHKRSETWTILRGSGEFVLDEHRSIVGRGDVLQIPARARHGIRAITDLELIEIQSGSELSEDDIIRIAMKWEDISDGGIPQEKKAEEL
jgi:mannose-1-phosphate guanylyltransferase